MKTLILFAILLCRFSIILSETRDINVNVVDERNGLSHQSVNCFWEDEFGFIWIGTQNGLNRFDGYEVETYLPDNHCSYSILSNNIRQICGDKKGYLFIRSLQCVEVYDMRSERFRMVFEGNTGAISYINNMLYIASENVIYVKQKGMLPIIKYKLPIGEEINNLKVNKLKNELILSTISGKLYFVSIESGKINHMIQTGYVNNINIDNQQRIWISSRDLGISVIESGEVRRVFNTSNGLLHNNAREICQLNDSLLYISSYGGLQMLNTRTGKFVTYNYILKDEIHNVNSILSMYLDSNKTLWMGTFYRGVQYYNLHNDRYNFFTPSVISSNIVSAIAEDKNACIWLGTEGKGIKRLDTNDEHFFDVQDEIVKSLYYDKNANRMWAATLYNGIKFVDLDYGHIGVVSPCVYTEQKGKSFSAQNIVKIIQSPFNNNRLLLATRRGLVELDKTQMKLYEINNKKLLGEDISQVWDICIDKDTLWVITSYKLYIVDLKTNKRQSFTVEDLSHKKNKQHFNSILKSISGDIYLGTTGTGLFCYKKSLGTFINYAVHNGLEGGFIYGLQQSPIDGKIYIATNIGISRFSESENKFENFSYRENWPIRSVTPGGFYISNAGILYINGREGLIKVQSEDLDQIVDNYDIFIKNIWIDNTIVSPKDSLYTDSSILYKKALILPPHTKSVSFAVMSNNWNNIPGTELEYLLEGFDKSFTTVHNRRIIYTNLPSGKYKLVVRGGKKNLLGEYPQTEFSLTVLAPFYLRWWFIILVVIFVLSIIYFLYSLYWGRYILRQKLNQEKNEKIKNEELNQKKLRFFTNISHEFRTPLTLIMGQLELLLARRDIKPTIYNLLLGIYKNAKRMNFLVDEVIDIRKHEQNYLKLNVIQYNIVVLLHEIYLSFKDYANQKGINLVFSPYNKDIMLWIDKNQIEKVFYNLISNAIKYTHSEGTVLIEIIEEEQWVIIKVEDTGIGISELDLPHVFERFWQSDTNMPLENHGSGIGLALVKSVIDMHEGKVEVTSKLGKGSIFTVYLKRGCTFSGENIVIHNNSETIDKAYLVENNLCADIKPYESNEDKIIQAKVLIVEDNIEVQSLLENIFSSIYEVYTSNNGEEGLEHARELQPDLIISDIMMPKMSGLELCSRLKTELTTSHIPVVLLTAKNAEEHIVEGLLTGADDYVTKPFNVNILIARCNNIINQRRRLQSIFKKDINSDCSILTVTPEDNKFIINATNIVNLHINDEKFDVQIFARELGVSRTILFTKIKGITGQTPNDYIISLRLKHAMAKLQNEPDKSIADIAYESGFTSPSYFIRCFKNTYNMTPAVFRKQLKISDISVK